MQLFGSRAPMTALIIETSLIRKYSQNDEIHGIYDIKQCIWNDLVAAEWACVSHSVAAEWAYGGVSHSVLVCDFPVLLLG